MFCFKNGWKTMLILGIYTAFVFVCWNWFTSAGINNFINSIEESNRRIPTSQTLKKNVIIYAATTFFGYPITSDAVSGTCPEVKEFCRVTTNFSEAGLADSIVFYSRNFYDTSHTLPLLKKLRRPDVPWVIWSTESPTHDKYPTEKDLFNWTMTYRKDADLWATYGYLEKRSVPENYDLNQIWDFKNNTVTWLGSNCHTANNRLLLFKSMMNKGLKVDIWGACGNPAGACHGVLKQSKPCVLDLIRPYKFYLAIENSNCKDYVTEKFWKSLGDRMIVPIVLTRKVIRDLGVPDSAYIAVDDFSTLSEFVDYVNKVSSDKDLYLKYHEWRRDYKVAFTNEFSGWCSLCKRLQDKKLVMDNQKSYSDAERWHSFGMCDDSLTMKYLN